MKRLLLSLTLAVLVISSAVQAQTPIPPLYLKNHTVHIQSGIDDLKFSNDEVVNGKIYRIVQESNMKYFKLNMKNESFEVLEYLPHNAFLISINTSQVEDFKKILFQLSARVAKWQPEWKLSPRLFKSDIPEWAWLDNKHIKTWIQTYSNIDPQTAVQLIQNQGLEIIDTKPDLQFYAIAMKPEDASKIAALPFVSYLQEMEDPGQIENHSARTDHRVNTLQSTHSGAPYYDGTGVTVGHGDDGALDNHIDYIGRLTQSSPPSDGDHGDHVAGTIFGAGNIDPKGKGMAPGAEIYYQDYPDNLNNVDQDFISQNVRITSSSYSNGCNAGYTGFSRQMDLDMDDNNTLLHVFSAGNSGTSDCGYGAGSFWGNVTGGHKIAKNVVTVANLTHTDVLASSSSRGPSEDGRIKPDISAVGTSVYSTTDLPYPNSYTTKTGTSMSCPGVSGTLATLYEAYRDKVGGDPHASLLKGIVLNTADDLGNPGPDFKHGYGRINARRAYNVINAQNFMSDSITGTTKSFTINMPATGTVKEVKIMLIWPDPAPSLSASKVLVNDLDISVTQGSNSYLPLVLNPNPNATTLNANAVQARDSLNNIEQVVISNPGSSNITVDVSAFNLPSGGQKFFVTYEFVMDEVILTYPIGGEGLVPGEVEYIRWDASDGTTTFTLKYSSDGGASWNTLGSANSSLRSYIWVVPSTVTNQGKMRITRGSQVSESPATFTIIPTPADLEFIRQCPDSATLAWRPVNGSTGYIMHQLGAKYMDSIGYTTDTSFSFPVTNLIQQNQWFSVAATKDSISGRRAIAIEKPTTLLNCILNNDLTVSKLLTPQPGFMTDCFDYNQTSIKVRVTNNGITNAFNFDLNYHIKGATIVTESITDTIAPGGFIDYEFSPANTFVAGSNYYIDVWSSYPSDENIYNDTLNERLFIFAGAPVSPPYMQDFENFARCGTLSNCSNDNCNLSQNWLNAPNNDFDNIDWRTNDGPTPSSGTGPTVDANPGTSTGKYLYLEASGGCDSNEAVLLSPCLDLSNVSGSAYFTYQYHMNGFDMGKLDVDIITEDESFKNVRPTLAGNKGNLWYTDSIDLSAYIGEKVLIQFRGKTGFGYRSDLALDNFQFHGNKIGLDENPLDNSTLFPNPTAGTFTIILPASHTGNVDFSVTSTTGKLVYSQSVDANGQSKFKLDIKHLPHGAYIVSVSTKNGFKNLSIIKQ